MATTVELKEGEVIYQKSEIDELLRQLDEVRDRFELAQTNTAADKETIRKQTVLINQANKVVAGVEKVVPGLFSGKGLAGMDLTVLANPTKLSALGPDCELLKKLMDEYGKNKPVILNKA